jgi:hypothetical protein
MYIYPGGMVVASGYPRLHVPLGDGPLRPLPHILYIPAKLALTHLAQARLADYSSPTSTCLP